MLKAIGGARKTITFESYIYWSGDTGAAFTQALIERAKAGVEVEKYNPWRWNTLARINNRTHRKIMVVDGSGSTPWASSVRSFEKKGVFLRHRFMKTG